MAKPFFYKPGIPLARIAFGCGLAQSIDLANKYIESGLLLLDGAPVTDTNMEVPPGEHRVAIGEHTVKAPPLDPNDKDGWKDMLVKETSPVSFIVTQPEIQEEL